MITVQQKADIASAVTVGLSSVGLLQYMNGWAAEFMPLITAFSILVTLGMTAWYYRSIVRQRRRENDLKAEDFRKRRANDENN